MKSNLYQDKEARERLISGIRKCALAVGGTMGTAGHNALIETIEHPGQMVTNDGATILAAIHFEDPLEEMGRKILLEAVSRANKASGDGSSTTTVLTAAILEEGLEHLTEASPMAIKKSIEDCLPAIEESLLKQTRPIVVDGVLNYTLLKQVATISSEDESIGTMIADIYAQIGVGGIIHWDISKSFDDHYTVGNGITVDGAGFTSPYFADMNEATGQFGTSLRWKKPMIMLVKQKITTAADFESLFKTLNDNGHKEVIIFCDEYEPTVIPQLVQTRVVRGFKTALVKMPVLWKDYWYQDLATATGASIVDGLGVNFKTMNATHLGTCDNIVVDKENTYLDGIKDVSTHVKQLTEEGSDDSLLRASRLNTQTARYYVGAKSDSALSYRRLKVEDAINSAYHALQHGIVAGGGIALRNCADEISNPILKKALKQPLRQIMDNGGAKEIPMDDSFKGTRGYDSRTGNFVDMFEEGIVDSADVVLTAVQNAISVAATVLTCPVVIQLPRQSFTDTLIQEIMTRKHA
jgi:chaperonin GroEL